MSRDYHITYYTLHQCRELDSQTDFVCLDGRSTVTQVPHYGQSYRTVVCTVDPIPLACTEEVSIEQLKGSL